MSALFVALGIMVLALLALLLWFVPHLLHQQAARVAGETAQLREMLLDLLNEQESVALRQTQLGTSLSTLQSRIETIVREPAVQSQHPTPASEDSIQQLERRLSELQIQIQQWADPRQNGAQKRAVQDNESWAYLMSLLSSIQERVGQLSHDRATAAAGLQVTVLIEELDQEMQHLRTISEEITVIQQRLRRSLHERENSLSSLRARVGTGA